MPTPLAVGVQEDDKRVVVAVEPPLRFRLSDFFELSRLFFCCLAHFFLWFFVTSSPAAVFVGTPASSHAEYVAFLNMSFGLPNATTSPTSILICPLPCAVCSMAIRRQLRGHARPRLTAGGQARRTTKADARCPWTQARLRAYHAYLVFWSGPEGEERCRQRSA